MTTSVDRYSGVRDGLGRKAPVRVATTANITLSGLQTIDGVALAAGDRVLVWQQSDGVSNGIYNASTGNWQRSLDFNGNRDIADGTGVIATAGTLYARIEFVVSSPNPVVIGSTPITFVRLIAEGFPPAARAHPFDGAVPIIIRDDANAHYWPGPVYYEPNDDTLWVSWVEGIKHDIGSPSFVKAAKIGHGTDLRDEVMVFSRSDRNVQHTQGGLVNDGRMLFLHSSFDGSSVPKLNASYTDDDGLNFTQVDVTVSNPWGLGYGPMLPGATEDTWNFFGYTQNGVSYEIIRVSTDDNGATYDSAIALSGSGALVEPWVLRLDSSRWFMFLRDDDGGQMMVSLSEDGGETWSVPVASGLTLGANPLSAELSGANLYLYAFARRGSPIGSRTDVWLYFEVDSETLWDAAGVFPVANRTAYVAAAGRTNMIGYVYTASSPTGRIALYMDGEEAVGTANASGSRLVLLSTDNPAVAGPGIIKTLRPGKNLLRNGCLQLATRATSFSGVTTDSRIFDGWRFDPNAGSMTLSRGSVSAEVSRLLPHSPTYQWNFDSSASPKAFMGIYQRTTDQELMRRMSSRKLTVQVWGFGAIPPKLDTFISISTGSGGSPASVTTATTVLRSSPMPFGAWHLVGQIVAPSLVGVTLGTGAFLSFYLRSDSTTAWNGALCGIKLEFGDPSPLEFGENDTEAFNLSFIERLSFPASTIVGVGVGNGTADVETFIKFQPKVSVPHTITPSSLIALAVGATATNDLSVDYASTTTARLVTTMSAGILTGNYAAPIYADNAINFLIDAEV